MAGLIIVVILVAIIGMIVLEYAMANHTSHTETFRSPGDALIVIERKFIGKLHTIERNGYSMTVRSRLKRDAPTLHIEATPSGSGAAVSTHAVYTMEKRGILPFIPKHGLWIWRKQRAIANALNRDAPSTPAAGLAGTPGT